MVILLLVDDTRVVLFLFRCCAIKGDAAIKGDSLRLRDLNSEASDFKFSFGVSWSLSSVFGGTGQAALLGSLWSSSDELSDFLASPGIKGN